MIFQNTWNTSYYLNKRQNTLLHVITGTFAIPSVIKNPPLNGGLLAGVAGFEPTKWRNQNPLPYHLATPQKARTEQSLRPNLNSF